MIFSELLHFFLLPRTTERDRILYNPQTALPIEAIYRLPSTLAFAVHFFIALAHNPQLHLATLRPTCWVSDRAASSKAGLQRGLMSGELCRIGKKNCYIKSIMFIN